MEKVKSASKNLKVEQKKLLTFDLSASRQIGDGGFKLISQFQQASTSEFLNFFSDNMAV